MSDALLPYYESELAAIRELAADFARAHPRVAERLRLSPESVADPHVERLLEGVAFLAARVQHRLDDELPELTDTLLDLLSPALLAPLPSMTTLRLNPQKESRGPQQVPRGLLLETGPVRGEPVRFATCQAVTLWPIRVEAARLTGLPLEAPPNPRSGRAAACLQLTLRTTAPDLTFAELGLNRLRLHLTGTGSLPTQIHELLAGSILGIALADGREDPRPTFLPPSALKTAGFAPEEAALPWPRRAFSGYRLVAEYFAFPEKFLYLDLEELDRRSLVQRSDRLEVFLYLARPLPELERNLGAANFLLGCTPAVNLFPQRCEPIALDGTQADWLLLPDARRPAALEVCAVESVRETRPDGTWRAVLPFHRFGAQDREEASPVQWLAQRRPAPAPLTGTETRLMLRDPGFNPAAPADAVLTVEALCCNRDLPEHLPFGKSEPQLRPVGAAAALGPVECLTAPTPTRRPALRERSAWRLVSHLALNHLSVTGGEDGAMALREILRLHNLRDAAETRAAIAGLVAVTAAPGVARVPGGRPGAFARGLDVTLTFEPQAWRAGGLYLMAAVLEQFLGLQVSVNSFVRTRAMLRGQTGPVAEWPPRCGTRVLL